MGKSKGTSVAIRTDVRINVDAPKGMSLERVEGITSEYVPLMSESQIAAEKVRTLSFESKDDVAVARRMRIDLSKVCSAAEDIKRRQKEVLLSETRFIDAVFNTVNGHLRAVQEEARAIEEHAEREEKKRVDALQQERQAMLTPFGVEYPGLGQMEEAVWNNFFEGSKQAYERRIEAERKAEEEAAAAAESERVRIEEQRKENERLKEEARVREEALRAEIEKAMRAEAEAKAKADEAARKVREEMEAKMKAEEDRMRAEREEAARVAAELKAKKDAEEAEAKKRLEKEEAERRAAEEAKKAPIKEQLTRWVDGFSIPQSPVFEITDAEQDIINKFNGFKAWAKNRISEM